ncbi:MAG TPA: hypothetical protein VHG28_12075 [Longimicrobiaceae bacterium]|nr:hypothetical protein [Longimicrobiaceae bacterium]
MNDPTTEAERLAALLDGRLDAKQRAEVLERLTASEEAFEAYVDAVAVMRELESDDTPGVIPLHATTPRPWWRRPGAHWLALAALVAGAALAPWMWSRVRTVDPGDPNRFVESLEERGGRLPGEWDGRPWGTTRGGEDAVSDPARAVRLGARLVDLDLAVRTRDRRTTEIAADVAALLEGVPGARFVADEYRELGERAGEPPEPLLTVLERGWDDVGGMVDRDRFEMGAWVEAGRIAAARRDAGFFRSRTTRAVLNRFAGDASLEEPVRAIVGRVRTSLDREGPPDWGTLQRDLTELLRVLGN